MDRFIPVTIPIAPRFPSQVRGEQSLYQLFCFLIGTIKGFTCLKSCKNWHDGSISQPSSEQLCQRRLCPCGAGSTLVSLPPSSWRLPVFLGGLGAPPRTRGPRARCSGCTAMGTSLWLRPASLWHPWRRAHDRHPPCFG